MTRLCITVLALSLAATLTDALPPFAILPDVPQYVEANADVAEQRQFVNLWKETLQNDGQGDAPTRRINFEPKSVIAPSDFQMLNLVRQHVANPLYIKDKTFADLRREFLLDHILLDPVDLEDLLLDSPEGLRMMTFSGKDLIFRFDDKLGLVADGVRVKSAMSLQDGTRMFTIDGVLFDAKDRVNRALDAPGASTRDSDIDTPLGPALDIESVVVVDSRVGPQPPAPHTREQILAAATAIPPRSISPPGLPPGANVSPPAVPQNVNDLNQPPSSAFQRPAFSLNNVSPTPQHIAPPAPAPAGKSTGKVRKTPASPPSKTPTGPSTESRRR